MFWVRSVGSQTILQSYTILYMILPFLGSLYDPKRFCNVPSVKKKKKGKDQIVLVPMCSPPNPTPHHSFSPTSLLSFGRLSLFILCSLLTHTHSLPHSPASLHSKPHHLTIIFSARSLEKYLGTPKHLHHFIWGKSSNLFWWVLCFYLRLFYPNFYNDIHVI